MRSLLVLNGPNINRLGLREPEVYGHRTLEDLVSELQQWGNENHILVNCFQSNHEGELIDQIHQAEGKYLGIIINLGHLHTIAMPFVML